VWYLLGEQHLRDERVGVSLAVKRLVVSTPAVVLEPNNRDVPFVLLRFLMLIG
jgi:hypothetical protein